MRELILHSVVTGIGLHWRWCLDLDEVCMALNGKYRNAEIAVMIEYT